MSPKIMIVTGEASGDLHGANLVRSLKSKNSELQFCGMGGSELESLGVEIIFDAAKVSVVGFFEVFAHLKDIWHAQRLLRHRLATDPPDLLILIDLPDFNLLLAKKAKSLGIPVFYYISPQLWAWRSGRVKTIKARVDKLGVILPFEEEFFRKRGVEAHYVGHPLLDTVKTGATKEQFCKLHGISDKARCIGLFPGSRKREVSSLLPIFLSAAKSLQENYPDKIIFFIPKASTIGRKEFEAAGLRSYQQHLDIRIIEDNRYDMMAACDAVVTASGTVTLELAILEVPMIVVYKLSPLTYQLGKRLVKVDFFSLVNLIAGYAAVPELLQHEVTAGKIAAELSAITTQPARMQEMKQALKEVKGKLGERGASEKAATVALQMLTPVSIIEVDYNDTAAPVALEINGILDLHPFSPKDLKTLIPDYLEECRKKGIVEIKIIHGKGIGNIRRSVHALLDRNPLVADYRQAELQSGSWGATIVTLKVSS
jgi:lipid-A-disaccharide synthase